SRNVRELNYGFSVSRVTDAAVDTNQQTVMHRLLRAISLYNLPPAEQHLVRFLLLLPAAALVICIYRNVIGIESFGTFAPALIGLAFRDLRSLPGILIFVSVVLVGWLLRRVLARFHLLQVPRTALMLSLVVAVLIVLIGIAQWFQITATRYVALF